MSSFATMQKVGKAFMLPIAILPAAGLLLGVGGALSNPTTVAAYPVLDNRVAQGIFTVMNDAGAVIFSNLALLLTVGLCIGLARRDKGTAALAGVVGYMVMTATITSLISVFGPEDAVIDTGIIGALVVGSVAVYLHNRFHNVALPQVLGFFGGSRFVPIVTAAAAVLIGGLFYLIWPTFQGWLLTAGHGIAKLGYAGTFLYGFILRLSGAVGLHHTIYPLFWYTELGGVEQVAGQSVTGAQKIFFAQLADPNHVGMFTSGTRFFAGRFATMMFGLPGAALAMYHCVPKDRRARYTGLFLGVALTSFITGITEPLEFMFLFVAPFLYVIHAALDGLSFMVADMLSIRIGNTFSGGLIDFLLFGVFQGNSRTHWLYVPLVGALWFAIYYVIFRWYITHFHVATPGHLSDSDAPNTGTQTSPVPAASSTQPSSDGAASTSTTRVTAAAGHGTTGGRDALYTEAGQIIDALGGESNINDVDACITRLRVAVNDADKVDRDVLKRLGAVDVLEVSGGIQAIYGAKAVLYKSAIHDILGIDD